MSEIARLTLKIIKYVLKNYYTYTILLIVLASYFTITPFIKNTVQTPANRIYLGAENDYKTYSDRNKLVYFKYLKTSLVGQNLPLNEFKSVLNTAPLDEKYYLLKGRTDSILSQSHFLSYHFSRFTYNFLFFLFLYLILSRIFFSRPFRLSVFSFLSFIALPLIINFYDYPHIAFIRLVIIVLFYLITRLIIRFKIPSHVPLALLVPLIFFILSVGLFINKKTVSLLTIDLKNSDKEMLNLVYLSKDFYAGIGYLRDNANPGEKVVCFKKCAIVSDLFAGVESVIGPFDNLSASRETKLKEDLPGIFDNIATVLKELENEKAAYFFIGPEERPYITPDFTRLQIKEVLKNKEVTLYKILPPVQK